VKKIREPKNIYLYSDHSPSKEYNLKISIEDLRDIVSQLVIQVNKLTNPKEDL
jgi:hypothetical protein